MENFDKKLSKMMVPRLEVHDFMDIVRDDKSDDTDPYGYSVGDWQKRMKFSKRVSQGYSNVCFDEDQVEVYPQD